MKRIARLSLLLALLAWRAPAFAQTPPTRQSGAAGVNWTSATTPKTVSISFISGDVVCAAGLNEDAPSETVALATSPSLTFSNKLINTASSSTHSRLDCATAASTATESVSMTQPGSTIHWGMYVWVYRGTDGVGTCTKQSSPGSTRTVSHTNSLAHSAVIWTVGDWGAGGVYTGTPTPTTEAFDVDDGTSYSVWGGDLTDQASTSAVSYGVTTGAGNFMVFACEIKGAAGAATPVRRRAPIVMSELFGAMLDKFLKGGP